MKKIVHPPTSHRDRDPVPMKPITIPNFVAIRTNPDSLIIAARRDDWELLDHVGIPINEVRGEGDAQ